MLYDAETVIGPENFARHINPHIDHNGVRAKGCVPRPEGMKYNGEMSIEEATAVDLVAFDPSEFPTRIKDLEDSGSRLSDYRMKMGQGGGMIPSRDQNGKGYCLLPGTRVLMASGLTKPIEDIKAGEEVISHTGQARRVIIPTSRRYTGALVTIAGSIGGEQVTATADHQFWTPEGKWIPVGELKQDSRVLYKGEPIQRSSYAPWQDVRDIEVRCLQVEGDASFIANGYAVHNCWAHSGVSAHLLIRARDEMPYVSLSAYAIACMIKNYRDEGGWGAEGLDFQMAKGCPSDSFWPQQSMSSGNDKPATWENAAQHKVVEGWVDLGAAQYDRKITFDQMITCLLCRVPVITDFNWWSHSVCGTDAVNGATQFKKTRDADTGKLLLRAAFDRFWAMDHPVTGGIALRIWNSWGDGWSSQGMGVLTGSQAVPDGAVAPRVVMWSAV